MSDDTTTARMFDIGRPFDGLHGTCAVVTGGGRGIGADIADALVGLGVTVIAADIDFFVEGETTPNVVRVVVDASTDEGVARIADAASATGLRVGLWVNNAGVISGYSALDTSTDEYERVMDTNVRSTFIGGKAAFRLMKESGRGAIVNLASLTGERVQPDRTVYGTSKAAISTLTKYLGTEWGPSGITVNAVAPGYIPTTLSRWHRLDEQGRASLLDDIPMRRVGAVREVTSMIVALASPLASYVTGQTFCIDGGTAL